MENQNKKTVVLIDMDNTIADLEKAVCQEFKKQYPNEVWPERTDFEFDQKIEGLTRSIITQEHFFENLEPIEGALTAIVEMHNAGFHVVFCTSPLKEYKYCVPEKFKWIEKHLGAFWLSRIIIIKDKTLAHGKYLIDDKPNPENGTIVPSWQHVLFEQPYNNKLNKPRISKWSEWKSIIKTD
jgi:5'-nucleotidase